MQAEDAGLGWVFTAHLVLVGRHNLTNRQIDMIRVRLTLQTKAAPNSKYGENVWQFWREGTLLQARGWTVVRHGREHTYMRPPSGASGPPFSISVNIFSREEILAVATDLHVIGSPWVGRLGEWPALYVPRHPYSLVEVDPFTGDRGEKQVEYCMDARFSIGIPFLWDATVKWTGDDYEYRDSLTALRAPITFVQKQLPFDIAYPTEFASTESSSYASLPKQIVGTLSEGALQRVEVNVYERDRTARELCISQHGAICAVCSFDFPRVYGEVADGLIHVHHLIPISNIGDEYQLNPATDLVPVCPNCHAVIHLRNPPYSVKEVRRFIEVAGGLLRDDDESRAR